ncbi:head maturation protease, ClpP-related [Changpingibacter yushuensis]|uniref:head maturation protease, ClpP-related n=1 Tax=Changpingibacter yushuensis TaxID=2758440 RepID=UPI00165DDFD9|nr:head maturation protease, ClpP-related [Changpingibacter yushuensis]
MVTAAQLVESRGILLRDSAKGTSADVYVYDEVSNNPYWGVSGKAFADQIGQLDVDELNVFINSPGGSAWDGVAIMNALRRHRATVNVSVDGLAASAASVVAMAGDHISMNRGSQMMIHDASVSYVSGNADELRSTADLLDKLSGSIADVYAARTGGSSTAWRDQMRDETWFTAEEAVLAGLADEWVDAPAAEAKFDLSIFTHAGRKNAPAPALILPASEPETNNHQEKGVAMPQGMEDVLAAGIRERLGITDATADATQILSMLDEKLSQPALKAPEGATLIDSTALADLQAKAEQGVKALEAQAVARRESIVTDAIAKGRITPASKDAWLAQLEKDEAGAAALIESFPENTIPVTEVGYGVDTQINSESQYAAAWGMKPKEAK